MGVFIQIEIRDEIPATTNTARQLLSVCPVEIFGLSGEDGRLVVRPEREDECTLCELCLEVAPAGSLAVRKIYRDQVLVSRGGSA